DPDFESKMHNLLLLYKKLSMQFDADGKLLPAEDGTYVHVLSYDEKPGIVVPYLSLELSPSVIIVMQVSVL
ncbi:MAG: hypothetical protein IKO62_10490, partial [Bacteroidales bacterium]|nr:hypothetical protein [Bacteroidales bacterium]